MSAASELFYGAIEQHEPEAMTFSQYLRLASGQDCAAASTSDTGTAGGTAATRGGQTTVQANDVDQLRHYYLAQADLALSDEVRQCSVAADCRQSSHDTQHGREPSGAKAPRFAHRDSLSALAADLQPPPLLSDIASELQTHLWMSIRHGHAGVNICLSDSRPLVHLPPCLRRPVHFSCTLLCCPRTDHSSC